MEQITDRTKILERWGEAFAKIVDNPKIKFFEDRIEVQLTKAVKDLEGIEQTFLKLTEPLVSDLEAMDLEEKNVGKAVALLASITEIPANIIRKMGSRDFLLLQDVIAGFIPDSQETAGK